MAQEFVAHYRPAAQGFVLFADLTGVLMARDVDVPVKTDIHWGVPHIRPYLSLLDEHERHIIVLSDPWYARLLAVHLGSVESSVEVRDTPHAMHARSAGLDHLAGSPAFSHGIEQGMTEHITHVLHAIEAMIQTHPANRLLLGGDTETVARLFRSLPKRLKRKVVSTLPMGAGTAERQVIKETFKAEMNAERRFEQQTVNRLQASLRNHESVLGIRNTLTALRSERIMSLVYAEDLELEGGLCEACEALFGEDANGICLYCGQALKTVDDLLDLVLAKAVDSGASVEQVSGPAAERLRKLGGIGALLRK
jgi:peptide chain release factor subunit 1